MSSSAQLVAVGAVAEVMNYPQGYYDPGILAERLGLSRDSVEASFSVELVVALNRILDMLDGYRARIVYPEEVALMMTPEERIAQLEAEVADLKRQLAAVNDPVQDDRNALEPDAEGRYPGQESERQ